MLKLEFPHESHKEMYENLCEEIELFPDEFTHPDNIYAFRGEKYSQLLESVRWDRDWIREWRVPSTAYFALDEWRIIWAIQLRHNINHPNLEYRWGHIGYWVRPSERKKWYATKMLELMLEKVQDIWLKEVLITADVTNIGSNKVILNNWWILEKKCKHKDGTNFNRYWITL